MSTHTFLWRNQKYINTFFFLAIKEPCLELCYQPCGVLFHVSLVKIVECHQSECRPLKEATSLHIQYVYLFKGKRETSKLIFLCNASLASNYLQPCDSLTYF